MSAYIYDSDSQHKSTLVLDRFSKLERFILSKITDEGASFGFKELNEELKTKESQPLMLRILEHSFII